MVISGIETAEVGATIALLLFVMSLIFCGYESDITTSDIILALVSNRTSLLV